MSSTILYKFRSGTTFEALPLPGSAARLFDVKKAIVTAKKLDAGSMDFDLSVRNASTNEEYTDESMLLPRGTRLVVQRLPAAKGHGFLARMARNQHGGAPGGGPAGAAGGAGGGGTGPPSGFYEIDSRAHDEDDEEFVTSGGAGGGDDEEDELAALKAVTDISTATSVGVRPAAASFGRGSGGPAGQGPPQHQSGGHGGQQRLPKQRANADPELRDQEKKGQPKKRATGIPRTFLSLSVAPTAEAQDGEGEGESNAPLLQPNTMGFEQLKSRGGGQSESASGTKKDLEYALKVTATTIPDYLQCALCNSVALTAMFLTWDPEGRTTCDKCIRDALAQNGFRDPLTGMEGISPDDLRPNPGIRKAAEAFVKEVMDKIEEIERQQVDDEPATNQADSSRGGNLLDGDSGEKGIIVTKRNSITKRKVEEDPFGGEDDFGGDVFAVVAEEKPEEEEDAGAPETPAKESNDKAGTEKPPNAAAETAPAADPASNDNGGDAERANPHTKEAGKSNSPEVDRKNKNNDSSSPPDQKAEESQAPNRANSDRYQKRDNRQNHRQRRGPPVGYQMGPAGGATGPHGAIQAERTESDDYQQQSHGGRGRGRAFSPRGGGRYHDQGRGGRGGRGRGRGRFDRYQPQQQQPQQSGKADWDGHSASRDRRSPSRDDFSRNSDEDGHRSSKRARHDSEDFSSHNNGGSKRRDHRDSSSRGNDYKRGTDNYHQERQYQQQPPAPYQQESYQEQPQADFQGGGGRGGWGRGRGPPRGGGRGFPRGGGRDFDRGGGRWEGGRSRGRGGGRGRFGGRGRY